MLLLRCYNYNHAYSVHYITLYYLARIGERDTPATELNVLAHNVRFAHKCSRRIMTQRANIISTLVIDNVAVNAHVISHVVTV